MRICLALLLLVSCSCSQADRIDQAKFEKVYRAAKAVQSFSGSYESEPAAGAYVRELRIECSVADRLADTAAEREMMAEFEGAAHNFEMALIITGEDNISEWANGKFKLRQACEWYSEGKIKKRK